MMATRKGTVTLTSTSRLTAPGPSDDLESGARGPMSTCCTQACGSRVAALTFGAGARDERERS